MHLDETQIILFLEGKLSGEEKKAAEQHLAGCHLCTEQLAKIYKLNKTIENSPEPTMDKKYFESAKSIIRNELRMIPTGPKKKYFAVRPAFATIAIIMLVSFAYLLFNKTDDPSRYRSLEEKNVIIKLSPESETALDKTNLNFLWTSVPNSIAYRFFLYEADGRVIWNSLVNDTSLSLPPNIHLEGGGTYLWRIEIIFPDDTKQRSDLNVFFFSE